jgi:hypothetical protein
MQRISREIRPLYMTNNCSVSVTHMVAVEAVVGERVSARGFPANRERYRENGHVDGAYQRPDPLIITGFHRVKGHLEMFPLCQNREDNRAGSGSASDVTGSKLFRVRMIFRYPSRALRQAIFHPFG